MIQTDGRSRVSNFWIPTGGFSKKAVEGEKGMLGFQALGDEGIRQLTVPRGRERPPSPWGVPSTGWAFLH